MFRSGGKLGLVACRQVLLPHAVVWQTGLRARANSLGVRKDTGMPEI